MNSKHYNYVLFFIYVVYVVNNNARTKAMNDKPQKRDIPIVMIGKKSKAKEIIGRFWELLLDFVEEQKIEFEIRSH